MADNNAQQTAQTDANAAITQAEIDKVKAMKQEFENGMKAATSEFMLSTYTRAMRALTPSLEKIAKAQLISERRARNTEAKAKRQQLKDAKKKAK